MPKKPVTKPAKKAGDKPAAPAKKPRKKYGFYKQVPVNTDVASAVSSAFSEFSDLHDECADAASNLESGGLGSTPKYEAFTDAESELSSHTDEPDIKDFLGEIPCTYHEAVPRRKGKGSSRATRLDNANSALSGALDALRNWEPAEYLKGMESNVDALTEEDLDQARDDLIQELEEHEDVSAEFPGMYG